MAMIRKSRVLFATILLASLILVFINITSSRRTLRIHPDLAVTPLTDVCDQYFRELVAKGDALVELTLEERVQAVRQYGNCYVRHDRAVRKDRQWLRDIERILFPMMKPRALIGRTEINYGSGIVIPVDDDAVTFANTKRLVSVLNYLKISTPVQIIHTGTLDAETTQEISRFGPKLSISFKDARIYLNEGHDEMLQPEMLTWLAMLFTNFDQFVYMEPDAVPFIDPAILFATDEYLESGAIFFRDRVIPNEFYSASEREMYNSLLPSREERIGFRMNLETHTEELFDKSFLKHQTASGMFALDRQQHFRGLLVGLILQLDDKTSAPVWGGKELIWIGQLIAGDNEFSFNKMNAAGIGHVVTTEEDNRLIYSTHTAQFDDKRRLLWMSGGLHNCAVDTAAEDWESESFLRENFESSDELDAYYNDLLDIDGALIPETDHATSWVATVATWKGWQRAPERGCHGYVWRAEDNPNHKANLKIFTEDDLALINGVQRAWTISVSGSS